MCLISGIKLSDASKKLGKKFATGASVVKVSEIACIGASMLLLIHVDSLKDLLMDGHFRDRLTRSKLMFKETYPLILWSSSQKPGLM